MRWWWWLRYGRDFAYVDCWSAAALVYFHELPYQRNWIETYALSKQAYEAAAVDWRGDAVKILSLHFFDSLDEHMRLRGDLRTGEAFCFAGVFQRLSE